MKRPCVVWESIHRDYRAGLKSIREIAAEHHISHTAVRKRAARDGWQRDLRARIRARAETLVSKAAVSNEVSTESGVGDEVIVQSNAQAVVQVRLLHRQELARARVMAMALLDDLQTISANLPLIERLAVIVAANEGLGPKESNLRVAAVRKAFDLASRAAMVKSLVDTMAKLIALEREAYGLCDAPASSNGGLGDQLTQLLRQIDGE